MTRRGPFPAQVRARALELLAEHRNAALARDALDAEMGGKGKGPKRPTLIKWAATAGIDLDVVAPGRAAKQRDATGPATAERIARLEISRARHSEVLLEELSRPAAALLKLRLEEATEVEELVAQARRRFLDALTVERQAADFGPDQVKEARSVTIAARKDLEVAEMARIHVRDLVGIITRSITDHLALEGIDREEAENGDLIVELVVPEKRTDVEPVPAAHLPETGE